MANQSCYTPLEKKVQEIDSKLQDLLVSSGNNINPATATDVYDDIKQSLVFAVKLLNAELSTDPYNPRLEQICKRLKEHNALFNELDITCNCNESCLNSEEEEAEEEEGIGAQEGSQSQIVNGDGYDNELVEYGGGNLVAEREKEEDEEIKRKKGLEGLQKLHRPKETRVVGIWRLCGATAFGIGIGIVFAGFMMVRISGCFDFVEPSGFPIPT